MSFLDDTEKHILWMCVYCVRSYELCLCKFGNYLWKVSNNQILMKCCHLKISCYLDFIELDA